MSVCGIHFSSNRALTIFRVKGWGTCLLVFFSCHAVMGQQIPTSVQTERWLAKDAFFTIPPAMEYGETFEGPITLPYVAKNPNLAWEPEYSPKSSTLLEMGKDVVFRGDVYCLEFSFKPVRMIEVEGKIVWYLLYRIRYLGGDLRPVVEKDAYSNQVFATPESVPATSITQLTNRFIPLFRLQVPRLNKEYLDQIVPGAKQAIAAKERVGLPIYDSIEIQRMPIKVSTEAEEHPLWGVATWTDVDARTDFFAVHVQGLTNAQRLKMEGNEIRYLQKNLVLHFSRPGDTVNELEDRIRYGIPALSDPDRMRYVLDQFGVEERLDHMWTYR
jgi:hypothetical protein